MRVCCFQIILNPFICQDYHKMHLCIKRMRNAVLINCLGKFFIENTYSFYYFSQIWWRYKTIRAKSGALNKKKVNCTTSSFFLDASIQNNNSYTVIMWIQKRKTISYRVKCFCMNDISVTASRMSSYYQIMQISQIHLVKKTWNVGNTSKVFFQVLALQDFEPPGGNNIDGV